MEISDIRRENLRALMRQRFHGKQVALAEAIGRSPNYISRCLSASKAPGSAKNIGEELARDIESRLGLDRYQMDRPGAFLSSPATEGQAAGATEDDTAETPRIPHEDDYALIPQYAIKGDCGAGYLNGHVEVKGGLAFKRDWLAKMRVKADNLYVIYADGDSMEPYIFEGDVVLFDGSDTEPRDRQVYAVRRPDGGISIKRIVQQLAGGWMIRSDNPDKSAYPDEPVSQTTLHDMPILGRVIWRGGGIG